MELKPAPRRNETKCPKGCAIRRAQQREWSDTHRVTRGLHEQMLLPQNSAHTTNNEHENDIKDYYLLPWFQPFLSGSTEYFAMKSEPETSEVLNLPRGIIMAKKQTWRQVKRRDFRPFQTSSKFTNKLRFPRKVTFKSSSHFDLCQRLSNVQKVPRLLCGWKSVRCPARVTQNDGFKF